MYEIQCETCGQLGVHESREGAQSRAEQHANRTDHSCYVETKVTG